MTTKDATPTPQAADDPVVKLAQKWANAQLYIESDSYWVKCEARQMARWIIEHSRTLPATEATVVGLGESNDKG